MRRNLLLYEVYFCDQISIDLTIWRLILSLLPGCQFSNVQGEK